MKAVVTQILKNYRGRFLIRLFVGGLFFVPVSLKAQEVKPLLMSQAIELSIKNSHQLQASFARNDQAAAEVKGALDNRLPSASVSGSYLRIGNPDISLKIPGLGGSKDSTGGTDGGTPAVNQAMYGIVNVSLPIYAGGKIKYGIESAKYLEQATKLDAESNKEAVILNTINAYVNLYKAAATVNVVKENVAQSNQRDSVFSRLEQNGLLARNDLLKSQLQTSNIELSLLDAENNLKIATVNMNLMLGYPETTILQTDSTGFAGTDNLKTVGEYEQLALQNRKDIQSLAFRNKAAGTGIAAAKGDLYPSLALTGGYIAAYVPHVISIVNAVNIGVGVKYNISSLWKAKSKIQLAKAKQTEIIAMQASLDDAVRLQINKDFENFLLSKKKIGVYEKAVAQAEENYRITKNKYDNSLVNTTELLDANVLLLQSKINLTVSKADVMLAYSKLLETTGVISNQ